ncbi:hypothetical protein K457DRAFT_133220 [Linnemannia elongata AG-77]|uniref:RING-CH-type domain-containing protein n=1 Tax=Linnemannia elongata AG-77 TaxID=1314771 RepID=A0A197KAM7_9FUNG|nr:hypothetical protein K457DRAFT_133220 [Linnemannia elongata AG-77]
MTFVDEQPKRQSAPQHRYSQQQQQQQQQPQQHLSAPADTANRNSGYTPPPPPGQRVTSYVGVGGVQDQYQNDYGSLSSSTRRLLSSTDSSPRSDHGHDVDPFQSIGPGATGGGDRKGGDGQVVLNMDTMSQSPPGYRTSTLSTGPILIDHNNNNNIINNSSSILNNIHNYDMDERRCRICLEGEEDDSSRSNSQDRGRRNHSHNYFGGGGQDHSDEEDEESGKGRLISPCLCKGSTRYIHLGCLEQWRTTSTLRENFYRCEICHYEYSFRRPWAASILGSKWFLRVTTVLIVILLAYAFAWIGRAIDSNGAWQWKKQFFPDGDFPLKRVMGLDWMDVVWGVLFTTGAGFVIMIVGLLVGMAMSLSCCCGDNADEDGEENTGGCFDQSCGWGYCGCYCGDCGGGAGGEAVIILLAAGIILAGLFLVFGGVYKVVSMVNKRVLKTMKETILEVK